MTMAAELPTTQRAYTLRLRRVPGICSACKRDDCNCWRDALWATHVAVNQGAKVFGEWLMTLRGGLDHQLADAPVKVKGDTTRPPTSNERRDRRILLALSWLSVENAQGTPDDASLIVAKGTESTDCRGRKLIEALAAILHARGVAAAEIGDPNRLPEDQSDTWLADCVSSLSAKIRDDAVWVNRSKNFDAVIDGCDESNARSDAHVVLAYLFSDQFLTLPTTTKTKSKSKEVVVPDEAEAEAEERRIAVRASSKGAGTRTRHLFSHLLGQGKPFGKPSRRLLLLDAWREHITPKLNAAGIPVVGVRKITRKKKTDGPAHTELQREMLSKTASRIAQIVTKQRQQEFDRLARKNADAALVAMEADPSFGVALLALRAYCDEYRVISGATGEFQIRPRQVTGWKRVLERWKSIAESDPEAARVARIEAVKNVQESNEDEKFGDANLFFRLAEERFMPTWHRNREVDETILDRYVRGMKARSDSERLKVAAYRHPDPYHSPVFCQFGVSRPAIRFRRLKAFTDAPGGNDPRAIGMLLWHPSTSSAKLTLLYGVSQRLDREIGAACDQVQRNVEKLGTVSRRGRLGAAAGGIPNAIAPVRVAGVFDLKKTKKRATVEERENEEDEDEESGTLKEPQWNGTLSADRSEMKAIRRLIDSGAIEKAHRRLHRLRWTLTVSMEMEGRGPWYRYVDAARDQTPFLRTQRKDKLQDKNNPSLGLAERKGAAQIDADGWPWQEFNEPLKDNSDRTQLVKDVKAARGNRVRLILSRLPGLRILSVDLGYRYAAACAVWESLDAKSFDMSRTVQAARAEGLRIEGGAEGLYVHVIRKRQKEKRGKLKGIEERTIYRRIGADTLPDGTPHPAPWARLDRQFLIKLQGEDVPARAASPAEAKAVTDFEEWAGCRRSQGAAPRKRRVDLLMNDAVDTARLALARHGRRARIAFQVTAESRILPGGRSLALDDAGRKELLTDTLADWHALATDTRWNDEPARKLWNECFATMEGGFTIDPPANASQPEAERTKAERRHAAQELHKRLAPLAERLTHDEPLRQQLHQAWSERWQSDDGQWRAKLKWLSRWLLPRGVSRRDGSIRHVGGLSLLRISTLTEFRRKVQVGFFTRLHPDGSRDEIGREFGQSTLDAIKRLKDQRIKQLTSRIVEAALGIGIERERVWDEAKRKWRSVKRPNGLLYHVDDNGVEHGDRRFQACHAVVIEDLSHYRPEETRTRRENRATMDWKSAETRKRLADHCLLYGLHLRDVNPQYTSRQDSRTGAPGARCVDVAVSDFLAQPWWRKQVAKARGKLQQNKGDARERLLVELDDRLQNGSSAGNVTGCLRIPGKGGDIFVSADKGSPLAGGIQADLNAAANIGLRALMDPEFPGKWWYVPCDPASLRPRAEKVKGSFLASVGPLQAPSDLPVSTRAPGRNAAAKEVVNLWHDPAVTLNGVAANEQWYATPAYWKCVGARVVDSLLQRSLAKPSD